MISFYSPSTLRLILLLCLSLVTISSLSACSNTMDPADRALAGGIIGAGIGALVGAGGGTGAAAGAGIGAAGGMLAGLLWE